MLRIALIGCGEHSCIAHAPPLARHAAEQKGQLELCAACDLDLAKAQSVCAEYGFKKPYTDFRQMIDKERPDGCVCIMPVHLTASVAEEMLRCGMPCVIEKPMGASIQEVRELAKVAAQTKTPHLVSVNRRFIGHLNQAKQWADAQGRVRFLRAAMLRVRRIEPEFVWGTGMHIVDAMRHLAGDIEDYHACAVADVGGSRWYWANLKFAFGRGGSLQILPTAGVEEEIYELCGDGFMAQVFNYQLNGTRLRCWRDGKLEVDEVTDAQTPPFVYRGEYAECGEFLAALGEHRPPRPGVADVLPSAELCARLLEGR